MSKIQIERLNDEGLGINIQGHIPDQINLLASAAVQTPAFAVALLTAARLWEKENVNDAERVKRLSKALIDISEDKEVGDEVYLDLNAIMEDSGAE